MELAAAVVEEVEGISKSKAKEVIDAAFTTIVAQVRGGEEVRLNNFLTIERIYKEARTGRNPHSGEAVEIAAKFAPKIKISKHFKDTLATVKKKKRA